MRFLVAHRSAPFGSARRWRLFGLAAFFGFFLTASVGFAEQITLIDSFGAFPPSPDVSDNGNEMTWTGSELHEGPGAVGTNFGTAGSGDGELPPSEQMAPGLVVQVPYEIYGIPGSDVNANWHSTTFFDVTLDIVPGSGVTMGIPQDGAAQQNDYGVIVQPLGDGGFEIWSTDPSATPEDDPVLLLAGTIEDAVIIGLVGATTGSTLSASVTYTDGAILDATGHSLLQGEFSWSLLDVTDPFSIDPVTGFLKTFRANATGQFTATVPEPGTLVLLGLGAIGLAAYARRKQK